MFNTSPKIRELQKAATAGNISAEKAIAAIYWDGFDGSREVVRRDQKKAFDLYLDAANKGDAEAAAHVAFAYLDGEGIMADYNDEKGRAKNEATALKWYEIAGQRGSFWGAQEAAKMYKDKGDFDASLKWDLILAQRGDHQAACNAGAIYLHEKHDPVVARRLFEQCGDEIALAYFYLRGIGGVPQSLSQAVKLYELASRSNSDVSSVLQWYRSAASSEDGLGILMRESERAVQ